MKLEDLNLHAIGDTIQMAGAVYAGEGKLLLVLFPEDRGTLSVDQDLGVCLSRRGPDKIEEDLSVNVLDMSIEEWEKFVRQTDIMETQILSRASDGKLAKVVIRKSLRTIDQSISWRVFRRDGYKCRYCGNSEVPLTVDHLIVWEEGGPSIEANLIASCKKCNKTRGNTPYGEWLRHPYYQRASIKLTEDVRQANRALVDVLGSIPLAIHERSR